MEKPTYFRRCHICGELSHRNGHEHIERCDHCGKPMARFHYFDDRLTPIMSDRALRSPDLPGEFSPLFGLTVYWESF